MKPIYVGLVVNSLFRPKVFAVLYLPLPLDASAWQSAKKRRRPHDEIAASRF